MHSKEVIERVFSITFPGTTEIPDVHARFKTTREQFILDMALAMQRRRETRRDREICFGWADSSPQGSFDWLIFQYRAVKEKHLMEFVQAKHQLSHTKGGAFQPYEDPDSPEPTLPPVRERRAANAIWNSKVQEYIMVPVTQGQGHTAIEDKAACIVHEHSLEADDHHHTKELLDSYKSFTLDLGTEAKTPDARISREDITQRMPPWVALRQPVLEAERLNEDDRPPRMRYQCEDRGMFLRNAMPIPGINHCMYSVVKSVQEHVSHYDAFFFTIEDASEDSRQSWL